MFEGARVGVVVPAYNEEKLIGQAIETVPDFVDKIIAVDDCSTDETAAVVEEYRVRLGERLELIRHEANQGVGGAIATGYKWCRDHEMDVAVVMAGDAQMDPADLSALLEPVVSGKVDYAKGNRLFTGDAWNIIPTFRIIIFFVSEEISGFTLAKFLIGYAFYFSLHIIKLRCPCS